MIDLPVDPRFLCPNCHHDIREEGYWQGEDVRVYTGHQFDVTTGTFVESWNRLGESNNATVARYCEYCHEELPTELNDLLQDLADTAT